MLVAEEGRAVCHTTRRGVRLLMVIDVLTLIVAIAMLVLALRNRKER